MIFQQPQASVWSGSQGLEARSRVAQLEAEIAQLKKVLNQRQQPLRVIGGLRC